MILSQWKLDQMLHVSLHYNIWTQNTLRHCRRPCSWLQYTQCRILMMIYTPSMGWLSHNFPFVFFLQYCEDTVHLLNKKLMFHRRQSVKYVVEIFRVLWWLGFRCKNCSTDLWRVERLYWLTDNGWGEEFRPSELGIHNGRHILRGDYW